MTAPKFTPKESMSTEAFFGKLMEIRTSIHLAHLSTKSYAQHMALGSFYEELTELTDSLIEGWQGKFGIVKITVGSSCSDCNPEEMILSLAKLTDDGTVYHRMMMPTFILNQLDEISALCYQTLYKLKNLN